MIMKTKIECLKDKIIKLNASIKFLKEERNKSWDKGWVICEDGGKKEIKRNKAKLNKCMALLNKELFTEIFNNNKIIK